MITGRDNHTLQAKTGRLNHVNHALEQTAHVPDILDMMTRFSIAMRLLKSYIIYLLHKILHFDLFTNGILDSAISGEDRNVSKLRQ